MFTKDVLAYGNVSSWTNRKVWKTRRELFAARVLFELSICYTIALEATLWKCHATNESTGQLKKDRCEGKAKEQQKTTNKWEDMRWERARTNRTHWDALFTAHSSYFKHNKTKLTNKEKSFFCRKINKGRETWAVLGSPPIGDPSDRWLVCTRTNRDADRRQRVIEWANGDT